MKKLSFVLVAFLCLLFSASTYADGSKQVKLTFRKESFNGTSKGVYRDVSYYVSATLFLDEQVVEIRHFGIGDAVVSLFDSNNDEVEQIADRCV